MFAALPFFGGAGVLLWRAFAPMTSSQSVMPPLAALAFAVYGAAFFRLHHRSPSTKLTWLGPVTVLALLVVPLLPSWPAVSEGLPLHPLLAGVLLCSGLIMPVLNLQRHARFRLPALGFFGALVFAASLAGELDALLDLTSPDTTTFGSPLAGLAGLGLGLAFMAVSLHRPPAAVRAPATWHPLPAVVLTATLTFFLWNELRDSELAAPSSPAGGLRQYLSVLTLGVGLGISLLVGLSIHFARMALSHLDDARQSNQRLRDEIEERIRVETILKQTEERLRMALDSTQIAIFEWAPPKEDVYFSPGLWGLLGYQYEPLRELNRSTLEAIHPDDRDTYRQAVEAQLSGRSMFAEPEYRLRDARGQWRWIYARARTVQTGPDGHALRIVGTLQDVTHRKLAEAELRLSQANTRKLSLVAAHTDNSVIITKADGTIEWVNESFERLLEYRLSEVQGRNPEEFITGPETSPRTLRRLRAHMAKGEPLITDIVNYSKSGKKYHLRLEVQPLHNDRGELENFIAIQTDISSRVETERNLRRAKAEADTASKSKSEFLASMSHEIRTPMNGVIGMTSLLLDTTLSSEQRDYVTTIRNSGEALLTIINDILDFSKIESGKMELERIPFDLGACIEDALDLFAVAATAKNIDLAYHIQSDVPPWILGDVTRLRQVIVNLVNNAVKFTPAGRISVLVTRIPSEANSQLLSDSAEIEIAIVDTGIGIPPERMDRLFKPFTQVDSSTTRKFGGTGLGLAICQRLCSLMGGTMQVRSVVGEGSNFSFRIVSPAVPVPPGWGLPESPAQLNYGPVLCVTENPILRDRLRDFFSSWGGRSVCVGSVEEAARELGASNPVAAVIDASVVHQASVFRDLLIASELPVLLLTPTGQSTLATEIFSGRRALIPVAKPVRTAALVRTLRKLLSPARVSIPPFAPSRTEKRLGDEIPLNILLVEDNPVNQKVGLRFLERLGYRADSAGNGLEAVNILETRSYDLVLMDLQMPEMDGLEASRQIRRRLPQDRQPKIIALTANALQGDRELCLSAGMDDYITKPVKPMEISQAIRRYFDKTNARPDGDDETADVS